MELFAFLIQLIISLLALVVEIAKLVTTLGDDRSLKKRKRRK